MKLSSEALGRIYKNTDSLNEFLLACSNAYYDPLIIMNPFKSSTQNIEDLPERELIELFDWWKKKNSEQKYTIQIFPNSTGYLTVSYDDYEITVGDLTATNHWHVTFTKQEIEQLKQHDDLAIDWDKAIITPVEDE